MDNKTITEYCTVLEYNPSNLDKRVNEMLKEGWLLYGNMIVTGINVEKFVQVMVKY